MYVDRPTCTFCQRELPALIKYMGLESLTIYNDLGEVETVIKPSSADPAYRGEKDAWPLDETAKN